MLTVALVRAGGGEGRMQVEEQEPQHPEPVGSPDLLDDAEPASSTNTVTFAICVSFERPNRTLPTVAPSGEADFGRR